MDMQTVGVKATNKTKREDTKMQHKETATMKMAADDRWQTQRQTKDKDTDEEDIWLNNSKRLCNSENQTYEQWFDYRTFLIIISIKVMANLP